MLSNQGENMPKSPNRCLWRWLCFMLLATAGMQQVLAQETAPHAGVTMSHHGYGIGGFSLFEPRDPTPAKAPLVVFLPGWTVTNPDNYGAWLDRLVKTGHVVAMVFYMDSSSTPTPTYTANMMLGMQNALAELSRPGHVQPDLSRFSIIGHSSGGLEAVNYAIEAADYGLPPAGLLFGLNPGTSQVTQQWRWLPCLTYRYGSLPILPQTVLNTEPNWGQDTEAQRWSSCMMLRDVTRIPPTTHLVMVGGDRDVFARNEDALRILEGAAQVPAQQRAFYCMTTEPRSAQDQLALANHYFPSALDIAYDNGSPQGITLFGDNPRLVERATERQRRRMEVRQQQVVNVLDRELWDLFDQAEQVAFGGASWTLPITPLDQLAQTVGFARRTPYCIKPAPSAP